MKLKSGSLELSIRIAGENQMISLSGQVSRYVTLTLFLVCSVISSAQPALANSNSLEMMPDATLRWGAADYEKAAELLVSNQVELLRIDNPQQKKFFERLTNVDNLVPSIDHSIGINNRLQEFVRISKSNAEILRQYGFALNKGENFGAEGARMLAFALRLSESMLYIMDEFIPTVPRDRSYMTRLIGKEQMRLGILQQLSGAVASLSDRKTYSESDLSLLLGALKDTVPALKGMCTLEMRDEMKRLLFEVRPDFKKPADIENLKAITAALADYK